MKIPYQKELLFLLFCFLLIDFFAINVFSDKNKSKVAILNFEKIAEIAEFYGPKGEMQYFSRISDICVSNINELYVADSGWNKIFRFDTNRRYLSSFGGAGQGPDEFLATPRSRLLKLAWGKDNKLYITDPGNRRITICDNQGKRLNQFPLPVGYVDKAYANSKGDIILIFPSDKKLIHIFNSSLDKVKTSIYDSKLNSVFPLGKPRFKQTKTRTNRLYTPVFLNIAQTNGDHLLVLSNNSLKVTHYNQNNEIINSFKISNEIFDKDFKKRLAKALEKNVFVAPFSMFLDNENRLCFSYFDESINNFEIFRYELTGQIRDVIRFNEVIRPRYYTVDENGNYYMATIDEKIMVFNINK